MVCTDCHDFLLDQESWTTTPTGATEQCTWCGSLAPRPSGLCAVACHRAACRCKGKRSPARGDPYHSHLFACKAVLLDGKLCSERFCITCVKLHLGEPELDAMIAEDTPPDSWVRAFVAASRPASVLSPGGFSRGRMWLWRRSGRAAVLGALRCLYPTQPLFSGVCGSRYSTATRCHPESLPACSRGISLLDPCAPLYAPPTSADRASRLLPCRENGAHAHAHPLTPFHSRLGPTHIRTCSS